MGLPGTAQGGKCHSPEMDRAGAIGTFDARHYGSPPSFGRNPGAGEVRPGITPPEGPAPARLRYRTTHEEVITDVVRKGGESYRQLPLHFYQVQMKFRDEIRPRFGVMRGREFLMKDGYSFHTSFEDLQRGTANMRHTAGFDRLGLRYRAVSAGWARSAGTGSHEFHVLATLCGDACLLPRLRTMPPTSNWPRRLPRHQAKVPRSPPCKGIHAGKTKCEDVRAFSTSRSPDGQGHRDHSRSPEDDDRRASRSYCCAAITT